MLFDKYSLYIHLPKGELKRAFRFRGIFFFLPFLLACLFWGRALFFWPFPLDMQENIEHLQAIKDSLSEETLKVMRCKATLERQNEEIYRIAAFNSRLKVMTGLSTQKPLPFENENLEIVPGPLSIYRPANFIYRLNWLAGLLKHEVFSQIFVQKKLQSVLFNQSSLLSAAPSIWPLRGRLTSTFGYRTGVPGSSWHKGIDISVPIGTIVRAPANGTVTKVGWESGYGKVVVIEHPFNFKTLFAHLNNALVSEGQWVTRGQSIAESGNTGLSTGPHLHYEVHKDGAAQDPFMYILE